MRRFVINSFQQASITALLEWDVVARIGMTFAAMEHTITRVEDRAAKG
jgi:hypothetical protein